LRIETGMTHGYTKKTLQSIKEQRYKEEVDKLEILLNPIYFNNNPIGFFDGAYAENKCGIGLYLKFSSSHSIKALFVGGSGNNMKAELMGLWGILLITTQWSIKKLMVVGDSKVTIDWINDKSNLDLNYLSHWKEKIRFLKKGYEMINFMHIHRQFNKEADNLSKKALKEPFRWLFYEEIEKGSIIRSDKMQIL
jgi:ribonuclease HI